MINYTIKAGTRSKLLTLALTEADGSESDLSDEISATLTVWYADETVATFALTIDAPDENTVSRDWLAGETDKVGVHRCMVTTVDSGGLESSWPGSGYFYLEFTSPIPRDPASSIEWSDVVGFAAELADVSPVAQSIIVGRVHEVVDPVAFGGEGSFRLRFARILLAAHHGTLARPGSTGTSAPAGPVASRSEGDLSVSYAWSMSSGSTLDGLDATSYGREFKSAAHVACAGPHVL